MKFSPKPLIMVLRVFYLLYLPIASTRQFFFHLFFASQAAVSLQKREKGYYRA